MAARCLRQGLLVAFPTETVYGLGADATNHQAVQQIFAVKRRPAINPLIVHVPNLEAAHRLARFNPLAERLAEAFWPGPLTLVLERLEDCPASPLVSAGLATIALRVPNHPLALDLLQETAKPLAAPSANRSGRISPTCADHVVAGLDDGVAMVLDGGRCPLGIESTVLAVDDEVRLLRPGGLTREAIVAEIGNFAEPTPPQVEAGGAQKSPGQLPSHYAPSLPLRLEAAAAGADEALLAFGPEVPEGAAVTCNLSHNGDLEEAAANLFIMLHQLDRPELNAIAGMTIPRRGLGAALNDRLRRAAAPRE
jgi:L-threonylcarbamoyladenylate synthase